MTPLSYHGYAVSESSSQRYRGILLKLLCLFSSILVHYKTFTRYLIIKYLMNVKPISSSHKIQAKAFTWPYMSFLCSISYIDASNKGIEQACSWASCDIHVSPFSIICMKPLAMNTMIRTHPLQMKEYPLQYATTDRNKKFHYYKLYHKKVQ